MGADPHSIISYLPEENPKKLIKTSPLISSFALPLDKPSSKIKIKLLLDHVNINQPITLYENKDRSCTTSVLGFISELACRSKCSELLLYVLSKPSLVIDNSDSMIIKNAELIKKCQSYIKHSKIVRNLCDNALIFSEENKNINTPNSEVRDAQTTNLDQKEEGSRRINS